MKTTGILSKMNLDQLLQNDKPTILACYALVRDASRKAGISLKKDLKATCESAGVNRTKVYAKKEAITLNLAKVDIPGPGRPPLINQNTTSYGRSETQLHLRIKVLEYRLGHPGSFIKHSPMRTSYSNGFKRFTLGILDNGVTVLDLSTASLVPQKTLYDWIEIDRKTPIPLQPKPEPAWPALPNELCGLIAEDYINWDGSTREFIKHETKKFRIAPNAIATVLRIAGLIGKKRKNPRFRGSTEKLTPGAMIVTDGKSVDVDLTSSGKTLTFCWQGTVDQATTCHTAVVVTDNECAAGVLEAYQQTKKFLGEAPLGFLHDNKPIHDDKELRSTIEEKTIMVPATPGRGENKAVIEGEFGRFEQEVGKILLDDTDQESLIKSAVREIIRSYTAGVNHAGRFEYEGKSRLAVVREACPDPEKDKKFIQGLKESHSEKWPANPLPTSISSKAVLDKAFREFDLEENDPFGKLRTWLAGYYQLEAIIQALAIFGAKVSAGALKGNHIHRYLVKLIKGCQEEISLREEESILRRLTVTACADFHHRLKLEFEELSKALSGEALNNAIAEKAVFGGILMERSYWETVLKELLQQDKGAGESVCKHIRRLFEASKSDRFHLISNIISWEKGFEKIYRSKD